MILKNIGILWSNRQINRLKQAAIQFAFLFLLLMVSMHASATQVTTIGQMATLITNSFADIAKLITAMSYLAGIGFSLGSVMKFKQHKDSPTQIPIGTPIALVFIAASLLFFPSVLGMAGMSIFGSTQTAGAFGTAWGS